ncbi:MAG: c-type cytochrome [Pseudomonadota bacterium]
MSFKKSPIARFSALGAVVAAVAFSAPAHAEGDAEAGKKVFNKCRTCHNVGEGAKNKTGPALTGIIGRVAGSKEDFTKYGDSIVALGETGFAWTEEDIIEYLLDPNKFLKAKLDDKKARSKMIFKLRKEVDRQNVVAYLATFSPKVEEAAVVEEATETVADAAEDGATVAMEDAKEAMAKAGEAMKEAGEAMEEAEAAMQSKAM